MSSFPEIRVGGGFDVHPFADGRKLVIGGVEIPHSRGLLGHSDADVLLHALTDAILGALGLPDIGVWFPNTSAELAGVDSGILLSKVWERVTALGWRLGNADMTILAEEPKLNPHREEMKQKIAGILGAQVDQIGIKATTCEKLGFVGRSEGIAAQAVVLMVKAN